MTDNERDDIIHSYGVDQAIEDGVLVYPYPDRWPYLLITMSIHIDCSDATNDSRTYDQKVVPLLNDCILAVDAAVKAEKGAENIYPVVLENTIAGTVWIVPNEKGGLTVMKPEDY